MCRLSRSLIKQTFECAVFLFLLMAMGYGQGLGTIVGTVTDSSRAVVPSATVKVIQTGTGLERSVTTNGQGYFVLPSLQPSAYELNVTAQGFRSFSQRNITLQADQSLTINVTLQVGASQQTVTVFGGPAQVDTTTGALSQVVDQQRIVDMPLNGRNAANLTLLVAGAVTTPAGGVDQGSTKTFPEGITISTNGARQSQISWNLDGGSNADIQTNINQPFPFPDALQEFSVQTSNYSARYGTNAGGVINIVTKSGTNQFHGSAFEFVRNSVFNARNYFATSVDRLKRNQFGGTMGGPIKRDKTFFFAGYQGTIIRTTSSKNATVPTVANLNGDFSALLDPNSPNNPSPGNVIKVIDPSTGRAFPGNKIPAGSLDRAALAVEKMLPQVGGKGQIRYVQPSSQTYNEFLGRIDHSFSSHDRMTGRYFYDKFTEAAQFDPNNLLVYADSSNILSQNVLLSETHVFSPSLLNEVHLSYSRVASTRESPPGAPSMTSLGVNMYDGGLHSIQNIQVTGNFFSIGSDPPSAFTRNSYRLNDDVSWIHGRHSLYLGGSFQRDFYDVRNKTNIPGDFRFNASATQKWALAAFLLGQLNQFTQGSGQWVVNRNKFMGVYIQDDFHTSRRLTLNLGLRYDPFFPWQTLSGAMQFSPTAYQNGTISRVFTNAPKGLLFPGDPGVPRWGSRGDYHNIAPRVGFAYDVFGDGRTSLRGGAGLFYDTHFAAINNQTWGSATPYSTSIILTTQSAGPFSDPYRGTTNPFPAPTPAPSNYVFPRPTAAYGFDPNSNFVIPVIYNWNLTIEHQLASRWLLRTAYVGSHAGHLNEYIQKNPAVYIPGSGLSTDKRRIYQPFGLIGMYEQDINASYNALQLSMEKRLSHGFTILANYTYSKSLDDQPNGQNVVAMNVNLPNLSTIPWNMPGRHFMDYGPSVFDRTHRFVASYVWSLPALAGANRFVGMMIGGWQLSGIATAQTGDALTVTAGADQSQTGLNADRAVQIGLPYGGNACASTAPCVNFLNPAAFQLPAVGTFGTTRKGSLRGPGYFDWDMGLGKSFRLPAENMQLQFRAEYFNVFNRTNLNDPTLSRSGSGFGQILGAQDPRIGQLSLKLTF